MENFQYKLKLDEIPDSHWEFFLEGIVTKKQRLKGMIFSRQ